MTEELVGRTRELGDLTDFVRTSRKESRAILLEGPPGVGKSALWRAAIEAARETHVVLRARPDSAEAKLAYGGLADLFVDVAETVLPALPEPQRVALETTLFLRSSDAPANPRLLGAATLGAFRALSASDPLLIAVDDLQWLDTSSLVTLAFATRRLREDERTGFIFTRRSGAGLSMGIPTPPTGLTRIEVAALSFDAAAELLARRYPGRVSRTTARRIWTAAQGNPLYTIELGAAVAAQGEPTDPSQPLTVSGDLEELLSRRLASLPDACDDVLLAVALLSDPTRRLIVETCGAAADAGLQAAIDADVLHIDRTRVRFGHPLFAAVVAAQAGRSERSRMHRHLAEVVAEREEAALHLALATDRPDAAVAAALDEATATAVERGSPAAAADYAEHALRLTDPQDRAALAERSRAAGRLRVLAGDHERGVALLEQAVALLDPGLQRALTLCDLAEGVSHDPTRAIRALDQAVAEGGGDPAVAARGGAFRATMAVLTLADLDVAEREMAEARTVAEASGDPEFIMHTLGTGAWIEVMRGRSAQPLATRAEAFPELLGRWPLFWLPERAELLRQLRRGEHDAVRARLQELKAHALDIGEEEAVSVYAFHLADLETAAGHWDAAAVHADELWAFAEWTPQAQPVALSAVARLAACRGELDRARELAERGIHLAGQLGSLLFDIENRSVLSLASIADADAAGAVAAVEPAWHTVARNGVLNPGMVTMLPDYIEALIALGDLERVEQPLSWLEARSREQDHPWGLKAAARCRGLEAAANGDHERAGEAFADALAPRPGITLPFEDARTLLARGVALRRGKRRHEARQSLTDAVASFEKLGATFFAERASGELARIGGRRPLAPAGELTPAQQGVAELVVRGASNKEIAASLFISEHTVESHLRQIYMKLGVTSRVQLTLLILGG